MYASGSNSDKKNSEEKISLVEKDRNQHEAEVFYTCTLVHVHSKIDSWLVIILCYVTGRHRSF